MKNYKIQALMLISTLFAATSISCQISIPNPATRADPSIDSGSTNITNNQKQMDDLVFSREGWIYFLPASAKTPQKVAKGEFPSFSRSKKQIVYVPSQPPEPDGEAVLMLYDLTTKKSRELYRVKGFVNTLQYAPEGDLVLFILRTPEGKTNLEVFNTLGEESFTINQSNKEINDVFSPVWSADGNTIYFHDMTNLFHVSFDGQILQRTPLKTITGSVETITSSDWFIPSPIDENVLVFTQLVPGTALFEKTFGEPNTALFVFNLQENKKTRLSKENMFAADPVWSPDGNRLYFSGYYDRNGLENYPFRVFQIELNSRNLTEISKGESPSL